MPLYSYTCKAHGGFEAWRAMSESGEPTACPTCRRRARRAVSAPSLACLDGATRKAHYVNERSADQPKVVSGDLPPKHAGGRHHAGHRHGPSRPWMIGH